jgi:hypothetical protein
MYRNAEYIFPKFMKDVYVTQDSGAYWVYTKDFRLEETLRANRTPANMATLSASTSTYVVHEHALKDVVSENDRDNSDLPGSLDVDTVEFLTDKILMRQEKECSDLLFTTGSWGNNSTLNTATSMAYNTTTSAPIQQVLSATSKILQASGKVANTIITNHDVFAALKENQNVYNRLAYTKDQILTEQILASLFDVEMFHVGRAVYETNQEGLASTSTNIWPGDMLVAYFNGTPGIKKATAANMFRVKRKGTPYRVKKWFEDDIEGDFIEVQTKMAPKLVATSCAYFYKSAALLNS